MIFKNILYKNICIFFCFVLFLTKGIAQLPSPSFYKLDDDDGLPNNLVYDIFQDRQGFIWLGTSTGLVRYDGVKFQYITKNDQSKLAGSIGYVKQNSHGDLFLRDFSGSLYKLLEQEHILKKVSFQNFKEKKLNNIINYTIDKNDDIYLIDQGKSTVFLLKNWQVFPLSLFSEMPILIHFSKHVLRGVLKIGDQGICVGGPLPHFHR